MEEDLSKSMSMTVPVVGDVEVIAFSMETYNDKKELVAVSDEDRVELATILLVKGGMTGIKKKSGEMEDRVKEVGAPWMLARGIKTVKVPGIGTMSLTEGTNVSISQDALRQVLINYVSADKVAEILSKVVKKTTYTTLQWVAEKAKK
jgi:hypothetical protein